MLESKTPVRLNTVLYLLIDNFLPLLISGCGSREYYDIDAAKGHVPSSLMSIFISDVTPKAEIKRNEPNQVLLVIDGKHISEIKVRYVRLHNNKAIGYIIFLCERNTV